MADCTYSVEQGAQQFGWHLTWEAARAHQLELARQEIPSEIVKQAAPRVDAPSAPEPQELTSAWVSEAEKHA